jgi:L-alanine-DL-glutamate epimerase-like enolase superfamily enzyme
MWEMHEYLRFLSHLDTVTINAIEYIEEPFKSHSLCDMVSGLRLLPNNCTVALDESLLNENIASILENETHLRIIHKTSLHSLRMGNILSGFSNRITITCTFETGVGLAFLCSIAAAVNPLAFHGIHPLHEMVHADAATEFFFNLMTEADGEITVKLSDLPSVRDLALRRI